MNLRSHWTVAKGGEVAMKTAQEAGRYRVLSTSNTLSYGVLAGTLISFSRRW